MSLIEDIKERRHYGVILENGRGDDWDGGSATFYGIFIDQDELKKIYLYF